jgi:hypothetical protein
MTDSYGTVPDHPPGVENLLTLHSLVCRWDEWGGVWRISKESYYRKFEFGPLHTLRISPFTDIDNWITAIDNFLKEHP